MGMMSRQARASVVVMGVDNRMISKALPVSCLQVTNYQTGHYSICRSPAPSTPSGVAESLRA
jgi:hypothetical protein